MSKELTELANGNLLPSEAKMLAELTKAGNTIEVIVPETIDAQSWRNTTNVVCKALLRAQRNEQKLLPVLGRLLAIAHDNKEIWGEYGNWKNFLSAEVCGKFGISPSSAFEAMQTANRFGHLPIDEIEEIPRRNMRIVLQSIPKGEEKKARFTKLLDMAAKLPEKELREHCEEQGYIGPGESAGAFFRIPCSKKVATMAEKFFCNPHNQGHCGSKKWGLIFECMMQECSSWDAEDQENKAAGHSGKDAA